MRVLGVSLPLGDDNLVVGVGGDVDGLSNLSVLCPFSSDSLMNPTHLGVGETRVLLRVEVGKVSLWSLVQSILYRLDEIPRHCLPSPLLNISFIHTMLQAVPYSVLVHSNSPHTDSLPSLFQSRLHTSHWSIYSSLPSR